MKTRALLFAVLAVIMMTGTAFAGWHDKDSSGQTGKLPGDIELPASLDDPNIIQVVRENSWECSGNTIHNRDVYYMYVKHVPELSQDNAGAANLTGMSYWTLGYTTNMTAYLYFDIPKKNVLISMAVQYCSQVFDTDTCQLTSADYVCGLPETYLHGTVHLNVPIR